MSAVAEFFNSFLDNSNTCPNRGKLLCWPWQKGTRYCVQSSKHVNETYKYSRRPLMFLLLCNVLASPPVPDHSFDKRVLVSKKDNVETKKVFVSCIVGPYAYKKRKVKGDRVTFTCNGCKKHNHYLALQAVCMPRG